MYLLDTMVVSEGFKRHLHPAVAKWMERSRSDVAFISTISIGEVERGIRKVEIVDPERSDRYRSWLEDTLRQYASRLLPVSTDIARRWGRLSHDLRHANPNLLIAATALEHDLTIVTRNIRHFEPTGVKLFNPYEARPFDHSFHASPL